jgi:hypothetical protein
VGEYIPQHSAGKVLSEIAHTRLTEQGCVGEFRPVRRRRRSPKAADGRRGSIRPMCSTGSDGALLGDFDRVFDGTGEQQTERCHIACSPAKEK